MSRRVPPRPAAVSSWLLPPVDPLPVVKPEPRLGPPLATRLTTRAGTNGGRHSRALPAAPPPSALTEDGAIAVPHTSDHAAGDALVHAEISQAGCHPCGGSRRPRAKRTGPVAAFAGLTVGLLVLKMSRQRADARSQEARIATALVLAPPPMDADLVTPPGGPRSCRASALGLARWPGTATAAGLARDCCAMPVPSTGMPPRVARGSANGRWPGSCAATVTGSPTSISA
jgi:hypothetical protein